MNCLTSDASGLSMSDCMSEKPLVRDSRVGSLLFNSAGMGCNSLAEGLLYLSKALSTGLPPASRTTCVLNSAESTPLSHTATRTGEYFRPGAKATLRAAQMSGLSTLLAAR